MKNSGPTSSAGLESRNILANVVDCLFHSHLVPIVPAMSRAFLRENLINICLLHGIQVPISETRTGVTDRQKVPMEENIDRKHEI